MTDTTAKNVILGIGAHPDDMDFTSSGTFAKFIEEGWEGYYVICTDGSRGSEDPNMTHEQLANIRKAEQIAAGQILGLKDVFFLGHTDTQLVSDLTLKEELVSIIRTIRPRIVVSMDPTFFYTQDTIWGDYSWVNHTDHRAASLAAMDAVFPLSRDRLTFPEHERAGLKPHKVEELWFTKFDGRGHLVDISQVLDKKIRALEAHVSQFVDWEETKKRVTDRAKHFAEGTDFAYAENFTRLKMQ
jgi:LmbE family N-acetylglucosaminyl deacetylase